MPMEHFFHRGQPVSMSSVVTFDPNQANSATFAAALICMIWVAGVRVYSKYQAWSRGWGHLLMCPCRICKRFGLRKRQEDSRRFLLAHPEPCSTSQFAETRDFSLFMFSVRPKSRFWSMSRSTRNYSLTGICGKD
jgi:hypothetical protein